MNLPMNPVIGVMVFPFTNSAKNERAAAVPAVPAAATPQLPAARLRGTTPGGINGGRVVPWEKWENHWKTDEWDIRLKDSIFLQSD